MANDQSVHSLQHLSVQGTFCREISTLISCKDQNEFVVNNPTNDLTSGVSVAAESAVKRIVDFIRGSFTVLYM